MRATKIWTYQDPKEADVCRLMTLINGSAIMSGTGLASY